MLKKKNVDDFRRELEQACKWLNIDRGRARGYARLLEEFGRGERGSEHVLAYYEADEIVQLFDLWGNDVDRFPGLKARLEQACAKGPAMTEDEKTSNSSNKPRNDAFGYLMAGKFRKAGISVSTVDGIRAGSGKSKSAEDFSLCWNGLDISVECKRPYSSKGFGRLAKEAQRQIKKSRRRGIIITDCSRLARPADTVFEADSPRAGADALHRWLEQEVEPKLPRPMGQEHPGVNSVRQDSCDDGHRDPRRERTSLASPRLYLRDSGCGQRQFFCAHGPARHCPKAHCTITGVGQGVAGGLTGRAKEAHEPTHPHLRIPR